MATPAAALASVPAARAEVRQRRTFVQRLGPHVLLVANGNASGIVRWPELVAAAASLLRTAGARVESRLTRSPGELAELLAESGRRVVLLGGDGSLHAAVNAPGPKPELALLPAGGANNVARSLGVPADLAAAARLAVGGAARSVDVIAAESASARYLAVEGVSVGFHALARAGYHAPNSASTMAGLKTGVATLARFRPITVAVEVDDASYLVRISQLFAVNTPLFGPRLPVAPQADPADGLLDVVMLEAGSRASLLRFAWRLRGGTHLGRSGVRYVRASRMRIATGGGSPVIADTTNLGSGTVELRVEPAALTVVAPAR